ncbi:hypothetical protein NDU88_004181 [Pleurodeles waltl]|uniref:Uncharacterized protein n=1 Tax=Pleurodeles waltl TaxID=8319 RepID=A0AAV7WXG1_PLEWA|nr:hypothetical protein NDU88_004180 [Pleurodeles waltl]KAJ1216580.1 hypothetical protein NDU88_004181 [Pleurodeles waltl]
MWERVINIEGGLRCKWSRCWVKRKRPSISDVNKLKTKVCNASNPSGILSGMLNSYSVRKAYVCGLRAPHVVNVKSVLKNVQGGLSGHSVLSKRRVYEK